MHWLIITSTVCILLTFLKRYNINGKNHYTALKPIELKIADVVGY